MPLQGATQEQQAFQSNTRKLGGLRDERIVAFADLVPDRRVLRSTSTPCANARLCFPGSGGTESDWSAG